MNFAGFHDGDYRQFSVLTRNSLCTLPGKGGTNVASLPLLRIRRLRNLNHQKGINCSRLSPVLNCASLSNYPSWHGRYLCSQGLVRRGSSRFAPCFPTMPLLMPAARLAHFEAAGRLYQSFRTGGSVLDRVIDFAKCFVYLPYSARLLMGSHCYLANESDDIRQFGCNV